MHEAHKGHEAMHAEMLLIFMITMVVAQIVLLQWKRRHFKSFQVNIVFYSNIPTSCILLSYKIFLYHVNCIFVDCVLCSIMGIAIYNVCSLIILEVYRVLGVVFRDYSSCCLQSAGETFAGVYSQVCNCYVSH